MHAAVSMSTYLFSMRTKSDCMELGGGGGRLFGGACGCIHMWLVSPMVVVRVEKHRLTGQA